MPPRRGARQQQQKQQKPQEPPKPPGLIRDPAVTLKLMEYVLDGPNGKRTLSRLARVSKALVEPGLGLLWKELDNLVPLISLFPSNLFKRAKRPGLGLAEAPSPEHWENVLQYGKRVRRLMYDESSKSVSPSIFPIIEEHRPVTYILPNLTTLVWRVETPAGLDHLHLFLNPELQNLTLEITPRLPNIGNVLADISRRTKLASFSLTSFSPLPDDVPRLLAPQTELDRLALMAPSALSSSLGRWVASLERLWSLQLDLTGRPSKVIDDFFRHVGASSSEMDSPDSPRSRDSGVFSGEDIDFTEATKKSTKKSKQRPAGDRGPIVGAFVTLRVLQLTGEVSGIISFLRRIASPLTQLELVIEDPFDKTDWRNLCVLLSQSFGNSLQSLKISASGSSRFTDLVRATSRGEAISRRLSLESLTSLPYLSRLEIDLPESVVLQNSDIAQLAEACPSLEILRLCPTARFPIAGGPPSLTLDGLAPLTARCRNLETLAVVIDGDAVDPQMYLYRTVSSRTLLKLHLGHSWVREPLTAALALSHIAPHADTLRWFHEKNRPGYIETHSLGWQRVAEMLPALQDVRLTERWVAGQAELPEPRQMMDKAVEARPVMRNSVVQATPKMVSTKTQATPQTSEKVVSARPQATSVEVDATPAVVSRMVDAVTLVADQGVMASPTMISREVDAMVEMVSESVDAVPEIGETMYIDEEDQRQQEQQQSKETHFLSQIYVPSIVGSAISLAWRTMLFGPNFVTARMQDVWAMVPFHASKNAATNVAQIHEVVEEHESAEKTVVAEKVSPVESGAGAGTNIVPVCI
ncbi:hypothetical protein F5148DRAFT_983091 [Russula earlei]|uniref:Uncharacterized protein n=1 Tax=Russula earlei TaxID=71964 RepID=A0ACC0U3Y7_9AGAM|nr:hypothetical protein F5148DRAFT_983091 [Russula earlei]